MLKKITPRFLRPFFKKIYYLSLYTYQFKTVKKLFKKNGRFSFLWSDRYLQLYDNTSTTNFDRHYVYHPAWAARVLKKTNPKKHIDISSTINFCSTISAFIPTEFYDYRPADLKLSNLETQKGDLLNLPFKNNSVESISCMHTVEHVGLGRYGDPIDPDGDLKAINELKRVLAPNGSLLFVIPIGKPKIMFNAHRIYSYDQILKYFSDLKLEEFSLIPEFSGGIIKDSSKSDADKESYACGCFWFKK